MRAFPLTMEIESLRTGMTKITHRRWTYALSARERLGLIFVVVGVSVALYVALKLPPPVPPPLAPTVAATGASAAVPTVASTVAPTVSPTASPTTGCSCFELCTPKDVRNARTALETGGANWATPGWKEYQRSVYGDMTTTIPSALPHELELYYLDLLPVATCDFPWAPLPTCESHECERRWGVVAIQNTFEPSERGGTFIFNLRLTDQGERFQPPYVVLQDSIARREVREGRVEVIRQYSQLETQYTDYGTWFYPTRGSGIFVDVGRVIFGTWDDLFARILEASECRNGTHGLDVPYIGDAIFASCFSALGYDAIELVNSPGFLPQTNLLNNAGSSAPSWAVRSGPERGNELILTRTRPRVRFAVPFELMNALSSRRGTCS